MDTAIYKANEKMEFLANDKEVLRLYHLREMVQTTYSKNQNHFTDNRLVVFSVVFRNKNYRHGSGFHFVNRKKYTPHLKCQCAEPLL